MKTKGQFGDLVGRRIYPAVVSFSNKIINVREVNSAPDVFIMPGLIDAHIHIESSMCTPGAFAVAAVPRGTTAVVSDPHEIANVLGVPGVEYMIEESKKVPLRFCFGCPSCVPATNFETSGGVVNSEQVGELLKKPEIKFLSEMMNFPGVLSKDEEVMRKIRYANEAHKPIDGHAPDLSGDSLRKYIECGISTDHECSSLEEAEEKSSYGMKILIREGSAARNLDTLKDLYNKFPDKLMLCTDDLHPETLMKGHINVLVTRLLNEGFDIFDVLRSCTIIPSQHYNIGSGCLEPGSLADFILVDDLKTMNVVETYIGGEKVYDRGQVLFSCEKAEPINNFNCSTISIEQLKVKASSNKMHVIKTFDGQLYTKDLEVEVEPGTEISSNVKEDILKIVLKDRYTDKPPVVAFINGFGIKKGAFAESITHDSHNIIAVGTNDEDIVSAINEVVKLKGGLAVAKEGRVETLPLPVAGIMSNESVQTISEAYQKLSALIQDFGSDYKSPFMTLAFMALLVIPEVKISDMGLFSLNKFSIIPLFK